MNVYEKLLVIQTRLKAPKNQTNSFGKYKYRSCEDILEAVKPLLKETETVLVISDDVDGIGNKIYIKATAKLIDAKDNTQIINTAYAREAEEKKGMDDSQITGTASSYARKYALNGLFAIDDTKDADTDEYARKTSKNDSENGKDTSKANKPTKEQIAELESLGSSLEKIAEYFKEKVENLTSKQVQYAIDKKKKAKEKNGGNNNAE